MSPLPSEGAWSFTPAAAPAWRPRRARRRSRAWPCWAAAALHAALLAAILLDLDPRTLPEPLIVEGTPLVWEGPIGTGEGAPALSPDLTAPPPAPEEAPVPPTPLAETPPAVEAPSAPPTQAAPSTAEAPSAVVPPSAAASTPAWPAPPPAAPPSAPRTVEADPLPLPLPPPPAPTPAAPAPAPAAPANPAAPMRSVEVPVAPGALRLGAGTAGTPGESRAVGAPQPGCQDVIGYPQSERQRGITGVVGMRLRVSDDGRVVE
ncbi:MAG TPA: hypothetical protein VIL69_07070, partial [Roseomonas sp.]